MKMVILKHSFLFVVGGFIYCMIEMLFRNHTHFSMFVVGGLCFLLCGLLNEVFSWDMLIWNQMLVCALIITVIEYVAGMVLNVWLGLGVWDYSNMPLNYKGQICLLFSLGWYFLSAVAIVLDDYLRYILFDEEEPRYILWRKKKC